MAKKTSLVSEAAKKVPGEKDAGRRTADMKRQTKIQKALYEIADATSAVADMGQFYAAMHQTVNRLMHARSFYVTLYDAATGILSSPYFADETGDTPPAPMKLVKSNKSLRAYILLKGKTLHISRAEIEEGRHRGKFKPMGTMAEDWVGVPLKIDGQTIGSLTVQSYEKGIRYRTQDVQLLEFVAQHIAVALTRARAIEETRQRNSELAIINSVQAALAAQLDIHGIYDAVGEKLREIFSYQDVTIYVGDLRSHTLTVEYSYVLGQKGERQSIRLNSLYEYFLTSNKAFVFNGDLASFAAKFSDYQNPDPPKSLLAVPMRRSKDTEPVVYLTIQDWDGKKIFTDSDMRLMQTLANSMSVAIENARLFGELQKRNREIREALEQQTATSEVLSVIASSPTDVQPVFDEIVERATILCGGTAGFAYQVIDNEIYLASEYHQDPRIRQEVLSFLPVPIDEDAESNAASVIRNHTVLHVTDTKSDPRITPSNRDLALRYGIGATLWIPLIKDEKGIGAIAIGKYVTEPFTDQQIALVKTFADQAVIAIENVRLFDELQKRNLEISEALEQQTATSEILSVIANSPTDIQPILDAVAEYGARLSESIECGIFLVDADQLTLVARAGLEKVIPLGTRFPLNAESVAGAAILDKKIYHVPDITETGERFPLSKSAHAKYPALLGVPLIREGHCIGTVLIRRAQAQPFTEKQIQLVKTFADQAVIAIENVRLFNETQRLLKETEQRAAELQIINSVQQGLASKLDMQGIYDLVGERISKVFNAQSVTLETFDRQTEMAYIRYGMDNGERFTAEPYRYGNITREMLRIRQPVLVRTTAEFEAYGAGILSGTGTPGSGVFVPLIIGDQVKGKLSLQSDLENAFGESDVRVLQTLASSMSVALENARLWEQEKMYLKALQRELEIGREIQAGFLPEQLPLIEGWEIAASLMSAREVAGDFYDAFELPDGKLGLVIADVCDKGVGAALFMTLFRSLIRATANMEYFEHTERPESPHSTAERLQRAMQLTNNYIAETHGESGMFATIFFGILDPHDGKLLYINGGHEPPLIAQAGVVSESLGKTGPAVGAITDCEFHVAEAQLQSGQTFLAFTDGVPDAINPHGEFFGREGLLSVLAHSDGSAFELVRNLQGELQQHAAGTTQFDDITLLAVTRA